MTATVTLIPGDGIGPEVTQATVADRVEKAINRVYDEGRHLTRDVGGSASTGEFTQGVIDALR